MGPGKWQALPVEQSHVHRAEIAQVLSYLGAGGANKALAAGHQAGFDFELLKNTLTSVGFSNVRRCTLGGSLHDELREMDHASKPAQLVFMDSSGARRSTSLFVEATRP